MKALTRQEEYILLSVFYLKENAYLIAIRDCRKKAVEIRANFIYRLRPVHK